MSAARKKQSNGTYFEIPATSGSSNSGTTYSDGSSKNSDRYSSGGSSSSSSSSGSGGSGSSSSSSGGSGSGSSGSGSSTVDNKSTTSAEGSTPENAIDGSGGSWEQDSNGMKYKYTTGKYAAGTTSTDANGKATEVVRWVKINDKEFAFGADGYMKSGWVQDTMGRVWYCDPNYGRMPGWVFEKTTGKWYYVDAQKGRLGGWFYDTDTGYWYYLDNTTGAMLTGWQTINGKQYYFAPIPATNTYSFNTTTAKWYYENPSGNHPYGSMYANTTTPDNHQVDADGAKIQ